MITAACCQVPSFQKDPPSELRESTSLPSMKRTEVNGCLIRPQNGVGDYDSSPQIDTLNGNVAEAQKRPKKLQVPATTAGGCTAKSYRKDSHEDNSVHDSLPSSPELEQRGDVDSCPAGDAVLDSATRELIGRFLVDFIANTESRRSDSKALKTMKRVVDGLLEKHRYAYNGMINNLSLGNRADDAGFVSAVARSLFKDGITNWGRIASLVAFGATVCQSFKKNGRENNVEQVAHEISTYLLSEQRDWLVKNNSWDGFVEFFRVSDPETTVRNALIGLAGFAGIGATLALLIRSFWEFGSGLQVVHPSPEVTTGGITAQTQISARLISKDTKSSANSSPSPALLPGKRKRDEVIAAGTPVQAGQASLLAPYLPGWPIATGVEPLKWRMSQAFALSLFILCPCF